MSQIYRSWGEHHNHEAWGSFLVQGTSCITLYIHQQKKHKLTNQARTHLSHFKTEKITIIKWKGFNSMALRNMYIVYSHIPLKQGHLDLISCLWFYKWLKTTRYIYISVHNWCLQKNGVPNPVVLAKSRQYASIEGGEATECRLTEFTRITHHWPARAAD